MAGDCNDIATIMQRCCNQGSHDLCDNLPRWIVNKRTKGKYETRSDANPQWGLEIRQRIKTIRGVQVMLDRDLAELYGVETKQLKRQAKRNIRRFPSDFMIKLSEGDIKSLRCQFGTSNRGGDRYGAYAFTEQGIAMLSSVLRSERAIDVNIGIMRAFVAIRRFVSDHAGLVQRVGAIELKQLETDKRLDTVFDALDRSKLLPCGILPANSEYDSIRMVSRLIAQAKSEILIIDPYADVTLLDILSEKAPGVTVRLVWASMGSDPMDGKLLTTSAAVL